METINDNQECYIPSVHFKNISPYDFLFSEDGKNFIKRLEEYQEDNNVRIGFLEEEIKAQKCVKCGKALLQDGGGWLHGNAKIFMTQPEMYSENGNEKSIKIEDFEVNIHLCCECVDTLKLYKETPKDKLKF